MATLQGWQQMITFVAQERARGDDLPLATAVRMLTEVAQSLARTAVALDSNPADLPSIMMALAKDLTSLDFDLSLVMPIDPPDARPYVKLQPDLVIVPATVGGGVFDVFSRARFERNHWQGGRRPEVLLDFSEPLSDITDGKK